MAEDFLSLIEVNEKIKGPYPIVVRVLPKEYEIPEPNDLPEDLEILLEKPKCLQFAHIRISAFHDEWQKKEEKGDDFVKERNEYVGQDFFIPIGYPGKLKLLNKPGQPSRYSSMIQVTQDLPRFIRVDKKSEYTPPDKSQSTSSLDVGTSLEIKGVHTVENIKYVRCKSVKTSREYIFREDFAITCSAVDDPKEHTMLSLAAEAVFLPKVVQFRKVLVDDVVMKNENEASTLLTLTSGPVKILRAFVKRNVFIAWLQSEGTSCKTVALIPKKGWGNQLVQIIPFDNETDKEEYIQERFGKSWDSSFVMSTLYTMKPNEASVIWLRKPQISERGCTRHEEVPHPVHKSERLNSHVLQRVKEKATLGFDKVHDQLLKRVKTIQDKRASAKHKKHKHRMTHPPLKCKRESIQHEYRKNIDTFEGFIQEEETSGQGDHQLQRLTKVSERNRNRPLPELPSKTSINVTDDNKLYLYDRAEDKEEEFLSKRKENEREAHSEPVVMPSMPDWSKVSRPGQSCDDFYSYSVQELEECFKMCGLKKLAGVCSSNQLDGAFFRKFDLNELKSDPFFLGSLEVIKVNKIIECGWRPKMQKEAATF